MSLYFLFNNDTKEVYQYTNVKPVVKNFVCYGNYKQIEHLRIEEYSLKGLIVKYDKLLEKNVIIREKQEENGYIYINPIIEITEYNSIADLQIYRNLVTKEWIVKLDHTLKDMQVSKINFSICCKNNPNNLYRLLTIDFYELNLSLEKTIPFLFETELENTLSVYTKNIFNNYSYKEIYE